MQFTDISHEKQTAYTLQENEARVFFIRNRSGVFTFNLEKPGAQAHIFALFTGGKNDSFKITLRQMHRAPNTQSTALVCFLGKENASLHSEGLVRIEKKAMRCSAEQKNTNLLLSDDAQVFSFPALEIRQDDVLCRHGSATSRINPEHLFIAGCRGISEKQAQAMLAKGFIRNFFAALKNRLIEKSL